MKANKQLGPISDFSPVEPEASNNGVLAQEYEAASTLNDPLNQSMPPRKRVVIIGGGFAGLEAAQQLSQSGADIALVDASNHHLFQPLLYQVATAALPAPSIAAPLRTVLRDDKHTQVFRATVTAIDPSTQTVQLDIGRTLAYDALILAAGSVSSYFGNEAWADRAPSLKTLADAQLIRRRIFDAFEQAESAVNEEEKKKCLSFVIVGAGPTGVELAGAVAQIARHTLPGEFRTFDPAQTQVLLVDGGPWPLGPFGEKLGKRAQQDLEEMGVRYVGGALVTDVGVDGVRYKDKNSGEEVVLNAKVVLWAAGVRAHPLAQLLGQSLGLSVDRQGRLPANADLSLPGANNIFVAGDLAAVPDGQGGWVPGLASSAKQMGGVVGQNVTHLLRGEATTPFVWDNKGTMATIGRGRALAKIGRFEMAGRGAWVLWLLAHLWFLVGWRNRFMAFTSWAWSLGRFGTAARAIWGEDPLPGRAKAATRNGEIPPSE